MLSYIVTSSLPYLHDARNLNISRTSRDITEKENAILHFERPFK